MLFCPCFRVQEKADALKNCHRSISVRGSEKLSDFNKEQ